MRFAPNRRLPRDFYVDNGNLAEKIMSVLSAKVADPIKLGRVREIALSQELEFMGEPTFARALVEMIDKIDASPNHKLHLISDAARITIALRHLIAEDDCQLELSNKAGY
jgi:hypothetical protein